MSQLCGHSLKVRRRRKSKKSRRQLRRLLSSAGFENLERRLVLSGVAWSAENPISLTTDFPSFISAADVDSDGNLDILVTSKTANTINWHANDGNQNFTENSIGITNVPNSTTSVDVDGDGDLDVLSASLGSDTVSWHENDGSQNFTEHVITTELAAAYWAIGEDFDGDGDIDVVGSASSGSNTTPFSDTVAYFENDGSQNFTKTVIGNPRQPGNLVASDVDGDGDMDVVAGSFGSGGVRWYANDGAGNFTENSLSTIGSAFVDPADIDGDGDIDIAATGGSSAIGWWENDGSENFNFNLLTTGGGVKTAVADDLDGDGDVDILYTATFDDLVGWLENDGSENFTPQVINNTVSGAWHAIAEDVDGDGDSDVVWSDFADDEIQWHENLGSHPTVTVDNASESVFEGQTAVNSGTFSDIDAGDNVIITSSIGSITQDTGNSGNWSWSFAPSDGPDETQIVTITATDNEGLVGQATFNLTVNNVQPLANWTAMPIPGPEGALFTLTINSINEAGDDTITAYSIDWDDGTVDNFTVAADGSPVGKVFTHVYADGPLSPDIRGFFTDEDGTEPGLFLWVREVLPGGAFGPGVQNVDPTANADNPNVGEDDGAITFDVLANDTDPAGVLDPLTLTAFDDSGVTLGTLTHNGGGSFSYDPNGQFNSLAVGETATETFTYDINDGDGGTDTGNVTITINGANDAPTAVDNGSPGFTTDQDSLVTTASVLTNDSDPDTSDTLSVLSFDDSGTSGLVGDNGDGTFDYDPNGQFDGLAAGQSATDAFSYTVSDGNGGTDAAIVTITINGLDDAPQLDDATFSLDENSPINSSVGTVTASDPDVGDSIGFAIISGNALGAFSIDGSGQILVADDVPLDFETDPVFVLTVEGTDTGGLTDTATVTINLNDLPEGGGGPIELIDGVLTVTGTPDDNDVTIINNGDGTVTVTFDNLPPETFNLGDIDEISVDLSDGDDTIVVTGFTVPVTIDGGSGNDDIDGSNGDDTLIGGPGNDRIDGDAGDDLMVGGPGDDVITGGAGDDVIKGGSGDDTLSGGSGSDVLRGGGGNDTVNGGSNGDLLVGGGGSDDLNAGFGGDILIGGRSNASDTALQLILEEWTSGRSYGRRIDNIRNGTGPILGGVALVPGGNIFDDNNSDTLRGFFGRDWYFAEEDGLDGDDDNLVNVQFFEIVDALF